MTEKIKTGVIVDDKMMAEAHVGQIMRELQHRLPASHFRWNTEDAVFTAFYVKIPTKVWHEATAVKK